MAKQMLLRFPFSYRDAERRTAVVRIGGSEGVELLTLESQSETNEGGWLKDIIFTLQDLRDLRVLLDTLPDRLSAIESRLKAVEDAIVFAPGGPMAVEAQASWAAHKQLSAD